jgi:asparagine synthase (glutamine-hydrolysing)
MCGIFGIWDQTHAPLSPLLLHRATQTLQHRGPDDEGYLLINTVDKTCEPHRGPQTIPELDSYPSIESVASAFDLALGFRRLSILDLSPTGHQPMSTEDGQQWIVFNGEIYNYLELRQELAALGYTFRTQTDTEVILYAYRAWGYGCLSHFNGMWAFSIWDNFTQELFCARDRFGIKPFYYFWDGHLFAFASEIKALLQLPSITRLPNDAIIYDYLSANQIDHTNETFFKNIYQLAPSHWLVLTPDHFDTRRFWDLPAKRVDEPAEDRTDHSSQFYNLFEEAVNIHLRSDVPIGTCLSGGLDSSAIVCLANKLLFKDHVIDRAWVGEHQKTFSSCFDDLRFDERRYIERVINLTGAESNLIFPNPAGLLKDLPSLIWHQEEPFGSLSIYAQWCVMQRFAEKGIRVSLDGQGGDEIAAGYHGYYDYLWATLAKEFCWSDLWQEWRAYKALYGGSWPGLLARTMHPFAPHTLLGIARHIKRGGTVGFQTLGIHPDFARQFRWRSFETLEHNADPFYSILISNLKKLSIPKLLHYEDRNSMAHSIEARVPFLDYRLVEFFFKLPAEQKIHQGFNKVIMRKALKGIIPEEVRTRTDKMGFVTPERVWLTHELNGWVDSILSSSSFSSRYYFNVPEIHAAYKAFKNGHLDLTGLAWRWINLELWLQQMIEDRN